MDQLVEGNHYTVSVFMECSQLAMIETIADRREGQRESGGGGENGAFKCLDKISITSSSAGQPLFGPAWLRRQKSVAL